VTTVVFDTVFFIRLVLSRFRGVRQQLFRLWRDHHFEVALSEPILAEIRDVLLRDELVLKHGLAKNEVEDLVAAFSSFASLVEPAEVSEPILAERDPNDLPILGTALAAAADFIVTEDNDLLSLNQYHGISILTPGNFHAILEQGEETA